MKRTISYLVILALAVSIALPFTPMSASATAKVQHTIIAATGDASPAGGTYRPSSFSTVKLNARHEVAFDALVGPPFTSGAFVGDGTTTSIVALGVNPDPSVPSFGSVSNPFITSNGDVVFDVNSIDSYKSNGKTIVPLVRDGDSVASGGTVTPTVRVVNDHGVIAYGAIVSGATATQGIFRSSETETITIARDDVAPPTGGSFILLDNPAINDRGQVAFFSVMTGGSTEFAIFRGEGGELTPVFAGGQLAPGGATFNDFGVPVINRHGQVADSASLINSTSHQGVFVGDGTNTVAIALEGQTAPKGGIYREPNGRSTFRSQIRLNDQGEVVFDAVLSGGTSSLGLFRGDGQRMTTIALAGTTAPGTTGTFSSFRDFRILNDGRVALIASLTLGVGGVNVTNNLGIWVGTSDEDLQLVARTGDVIGNKTLTNLPQGANLFDVNENDVVWVGIFGPSRGVVRSRILGNEGN